MRPAPGLLLAMLITGCSGTAEPDASPTQSAIPMGALPMTAPDASASPEPTPSPEVSGIAAETATTTADTMTAKAADDTAGDPATPSFNCNVKLTAVEARICANAHLAALDMRLATAYIDATNGVTGAALTDLTTGQRAFLKSRNACTTDDCISLAYRDRMSLFEEDRD